MNYNRACEILDFPNDEPFCQTILKRQYRMKALLYHPDKNNSDDATYQFQQVTAAYEYLLKYEGYMDEDGSDCDLEAEDDIVYEKIGKYKDLLSSFIQNIVVGETHSQLFSIILTRISGVCEATALDTLQKLDRHMLTKVYDVIKKYGKDENDIFVINYFLNIY